MLCCLNHSCHNIYFYQSCVFCCMTFSYYSFQKELTFKLSFKFFRGTLSYKFLIKKKNKQKPARLSQFLFLRTIIMALKL